MILLPSGVINDETMINRFIRVKYSSCANQMADIRQGNPASHGKTATKLSGPEKCVTPDDGNSKGW